MLRSFFARLFYYYSTQNRRVVDPIDFGWKGLGGLDGLVGLGSLFVVVGIGIMGDVKQDAEDKGL